MNRDQIEGKWRQLKERVREQWWKFTDDDLDFIAGKRELFLGRLQERYGMDRAEAERRLDEWLRAVSLQRDVKRL